MYKKFFKRMLDIFFSFILIILLTPFFLTLSLIIFVTNGMPIIYKQKRVGKNNRIFNIYKFKSMNNKKDQQGSLLEDEKRITKFGHFLRRTSIDELPQFFNVLFGSMSFIGPRPKTVEETLFIVSTKYIDRHNVKPGITGLAVINGRNDLSPEDAYSFDVKYTKAVTIFKDFKIFFMTIPLVLNRKGVNAKNTFSFLPHYIYWKNVSIFNELEINNIKNNALIIIRSTVKKIDINKDYSKSVI